VKPYMLALVAALCWGVAPIFEKWSLLRASPLTVLTVRSLVVSATLLVVGLLTGQLQELRRVDASLFQLIAMGGLFGSLVGLFIYFWALKQDLASTVVPVAGSYPLIAAVLGILFLGEPISFQRLLGASLVVLGVLLVR
jgi:bacterial/archaeal transporter family protein